MPVPAAPTWPNRMNLNGQDWDTVIIRKRQPTNSQLKDEASVNAARRSGVGVETVKKSAQMKSEQQQCCTNNHAMPCHAMHLDVWERRDFRTRCFLLLPCNAACSDGRTKQAWWCDDVQRQGGPQAGC